MIELTGSMWEGYRFGLGLALVQAQVELIEAQTERDANTDPDEHRWHLAEVGKKTRQLAATKQLVKDENG